MTAAPVIFFPRNFNRCFKLHMHFLPFSNGKGGLHGAKDLGGVASFGTEGKNPLGTPHGLHKILQKLQPVRDIQGDVQSSLFKAM